MINRSQCNADKALFSNGVIKGNLVCSGDPGGAEHKEPISGTYGPDFANVTLDFPMYGIAVRETFRAKRLRDCSVEGQQ